jgi:hypothetical protein
MVGNPLPTSFEDGVPEVLQHDRLGHDMDGIKAVYSHVSPAMRTHLKAALQRRWEDSLTRRAAIDPQSPVPQLDELLCSIPARRK